MNLILLYSLISIACVINSIAALEAMKSHLHKSKQFAHLRPNVSDIKKFVKPEMEGPYVPKEVDSLQQLEKSEDDLLMTNAEIVGNQTTKKGLIEKPTMYDTVIRPHATSIRSADAFSANAQSISANSAITSLFNQGQEYQRLAAGQIAIPVKIEQRGVVSDPTLSGYETPLFLQKKHTGKGFNIPKAPMLNPSLVANSAADAKRIKAKLAGAKNNKQRVNALKAEKKRLQSEAKNVAKMIENEVGNLLTSKKIGQKLNSLLNKYTVKIKRDELAKISLVDRVQIKRELKAKLLKEIEGFRTSPTQYPTVGKVSPSDLRKIVGQIKKKLGY